MNAQNNDLCSVLRKIASNNINNETLELSPEAINWALQTRLGSCLIDVLDTTDFSPELIDRIKAEALTAKFWFQTQYQSTLELISELNRHNITPTLLKGMSICTELYPQAHYRSMRDVDILVEEEEIEQTENIMLKLGYTQSSPLPLPFYETHHHTIPWQHKTKDIWFEIHRKLFPETSPSYTAKVFQIETINNEKFISPIDSKHDSLQTYRLGHELQIIYIAAHWGESFKQTGGLFALIDIALIINNSEINWDKLVKWANEPYISNYVYVLITYIATHELVDITQTKQQLKKINHSLSFIDIFILNKIITNYLLLGQPFGQLLTINNVSILWKLFLSPQPAFKKLMLAPTYIIFPPGSEKKFNIMFQLSRVKNLLFKSSR